MNHNQISGLSRDLREQLNQRIAKNESFPRLVAWLNQFPEVESAKTAHFEGDPISEADLHEWRRTGFIAWQSDKQLRQAPPAIIATAERVESSGLTTAHLLQVVRAHYAAALLECSAGRFDQRCRELTEMNAVVKTILALHRAEQIDRRLALAEAKFALQRERTLHPPSRTRTSTSPPTNASCPAPQNPAAAASTLDTSSITPSENVPSPPNEAPPPSHQANAASPPSFASSPIPLSTHPLTTTAATGHLANLSERSASLHRNPTSSQPEPIPPKPTTAPLNPQTASTHLPKSPTENQRPESQIQAPPRSLES